jgi:hypothetical protein
MRATRLPRGILGGRRGSHVLVPGGGQHLGRGTAEHGRLELGDAIQEPPEDGQGPPGRCDEPGPGVW